MNLAWLTLVNAGNQIKNRATGNRRNTLARQGPINGHVSKSLGLCFPFPAVAVVLACNSQTYAIFCKGIRCWYFLEVLYVLASRA